jgi:hypothetical protein
MHDDMVDRPRGNSMIPAMASSGIGRLSDMVGVARELGQFTIEREIRHTQLEHVSPQIEGPFLVGELTDILLVMPAQDLTSDINSALFEEHLLRQAGRKQFIIVELNQQNHLPTDEVIYPLINFAKACDGNSRLYVATRDKSFRSRVAMMMKNTMWTITDSGKDAVEQIDLEIFLAERKNRGG